MHGEFAGATEASGLVRRSPDGRYLRPLQPTKIQHAASNLLRRSDEYTAVHTNALVAMMLHTFMACLMLPWDGRYPISSDMSYVLTYLYMPCNWVVVPLQLVFNSVHDLCFFSEFFGRFSTSRCALRPLLNCKVRLQSEQDLVAEL